jgi:hypothetical protein
VIACGRGRRDCLRQRQSQNRPCVIFLTTPMFAVSLPPRMFPISPSPYEGNPIALVDAMACGVAVSTAGIGELLVHRETGFLCGTSSRNIRAALTDVLSDAPLRARLRQGGLRYVAELSAA